MVAASSFPLSDADRHALQSALKSEKSIEFERTEMAARDFGGICHHKPAAIIFPTSVADIKNVVRVTSRTQNLTVASKGNGHSIHGQAQASNGIVIDMLSLKDTISVGKDINGTFYADVGAGKLWIDVLQETLRYSLAPRTWTDYLHLTVGGTLQNAGVGGQTFKYGPQISNVLKLEVVTGLGEEKVCSPCVNSDLFYATLGGLGQFGIITRARIVLETAPEKVRWIRVLYADFKDFTRDQESLVQGKAFDYVEGFVVANSNDPVNGWTQAVLPESATLDYRLIPASAGPVLYCLELAKYYSAAENSTIEQGVAISLLPLRFIRGLRFYTDVTYRDFLDRVHKVEATLRDCGVWEAPHPWLCLFIPRSQIEKFDALVFRQKLSKGVGGPMLVYPMLKSKWDPRFSVVIPDEEIFYLVALLRFSLPNPKGPRAEVLLAENDEIVRLSRAANIRLNVYLPHFSKQSEWEQHFGSKWSRFRSLKSKWDPLAILAPGQGIFPRLNA